ncbi:MAG: hypothetical protein JW983_04985 [Elusimicrobia bacterium]|nr:hypothetical protein [Elusimicrobiota bacterium]
MKQDINSSFIFKTWAKKGLGILFLFFYSAVTLYAETYSSSRNIEDFENKLKEQQKEYRESKKEKNEKEKKKLIYIEPFCRNLAKSVTYWEMTAEEIQECKNNGFGYSEVIKVILISKKADRKLDDIIKRRRSGDSFKKIAERYKVDYEEIKKETKKIRKEVHPHTNGQSIGARVNTYGTK